MEVFQILEIKNINKKYKGKYILKNVSINISAGEIIGLIGENGAGKSTLMKIIVGLVNADSGEVLLNNRTIYNNRIEFLKDISAIIEEPSLYYEMSGLDHIKLIADLNNINKDRIKEIISFINIGNAIKRKCSTYSMGMKQRLAIGLALLKNPKVIILDEPTNGLDIEASIELRKNLLDLSKRNNISILLSSHILSEVEKICDKVVFITKGTIINKNINFSNKTIKKINLNFNDKDFIKDYLNKLDFIIEYTEDSQGLFSILIESNNLKIFLNSLHKHSIEYSDICITDISLEETYLKIKGDGNE